MKKLSQYKLLPSMALLRCFESAAKFESFTLAAEALNLTQSAVSRQVKELEQMLGFDLFRRVGRRVILTETGLSFSAEIALDLERIRQTVFRTMASGDRGISLRVATLSTFANRWLIPRLPVFEVLHPQIEISLSTRLKPFDFKQERFDLAIHFGTDNWPDSKASHLCDEEMFVVASPEFQQRHQLDDPNKLLSVALLHLETRPSAWSEWMQLAGLSDWPVLRGKHFDQFSMIITATLSSLGAGLIPGYLVEEELASGALVKISDIALKTNNAYYVVTPSGATNAQAEAFVTWLKSQVGKPLV
jgi:LysR family glycine cleavage system transcriptional activator